MYSNACQTGFSILLAGNATAGGTVPVRSRTKGSDPERVRRHQRPQQSDVVATGLKSRLRHLTRDPHPIENHTSLRLWVFYPTCLTSFALGANKSVAQTGNIFCRANEHALCVGSFAGRTTTVRSFQGIPSLLFQIESLCHP